MYPNDENNLSPTEPTDSGGDSSPAEQGAGEYHITRPDGERSWRDADYTPHSQTTEPPRYYVPEDKPPREKKERPKGSGLFLRVACLCLVCALLGGAAGGVVTARLLSPARDSGELINTQAPDVTPSPASSLSSGSASGIYELACKQVVGIKSDITTTNIFGMTSSGSVTGSGFVLSDKGYIMTNYHVIEDAQRGGYDINVIFYDGSSVVGTIVGYDADNDVAILKVGVDNLNAASIGNSDSLSVGDSVFAVGNPLGELAYTMTSGIVSATDRVITTDESTSINMFQFDAAVNAGNSGGPVYDGSGQVVGVVTAKYSDTGVEGLGFAIPINDALNIAMDLIDHGYVTGKAYMGLTCQTISQSAAQYYNMPQGAYVYSVEAGSASEVAGIKIGDIITSMDSVSIASQEDLKAAVKSHAAGDTVAVTIWRSGEELSLSITFDEAKPDLSTGENSSGVEQYPQQNQQQSQYPFSYSW